MEKVFLQIRRGMLNCKKKLVYGVLALFVGQLCFFGLGNLGTATIVYAADGETASQSKSFDELVAEKLGIISFFEKALYVIIYPLLFLAGKLVDNSFVYGEVFGFDAILWKFWNIVRNLANYCLGFMFLYYVFSYLIAPNKNKDWKKLIRNALIAGIGIQASWFLMAVLIDISTILTYSVGGLPLSVLRDNNADNIVASGEVKVDGNYNPYVLKWIYSVDVEDKMKSDVYMTTVESGGKIGKYVISECDTFNYKNGDIDEQLIIAPKMIYYQKSTGNEVLSTAKNMCNYYGQVYWFSSLYPDIGNKWKECKNIKECKEYQDGKDGEDGYTTILDQTKKKLETSGDVKALVEEGKILEIGNAHVIGGIYGKSGFNIVLDDAKCGQCGLDIDNNWVGSGTLRLGDLIKSDETSNSYVTVFTALYSSLLNAGRSIFAVSDNGIYVKFLRALLTFGTMIAIAIPLIVASLVFLMRIGIIRIAIALSPMIVLLQSFGLFEKVKKISKFFEYFEISNLIGIILSPAVICFAISMSLIFVKIIERINSTKIATEPLILGGIIEVDLAGFSVGLGQLIISFMGIAITWFLVWAAITSSKLGKSDTIKAVKSLANNALGSLPIIPIPKSDGAGMEFIGANSAFGLNGRQSIIERYSQNVKTKFESKDAQVVGEIFDSKDASNKAQQDKANAFADKLVSQNIGANWQTMDILIGDENGTHETVKFSGLTDSQKEIVLQKINGLGESLRLKFKDSEPISFGGKTYTFVENGKSGRNRFEEVDTTQ